MLIHVILWLHRVGASIGCMCGYQLCVFVVCLCFVWYMLWFSAFLLIAAACYLCLIALIACLRCRGFWLLIVLVRCDYLL